jgi:hypothetical protein
LKAIQKKHYLPFFFVDGGGFGAGNCNQEVVIPLMVQLHFLGFLLFINKVLSLGPHLFPGMEGSTAAWQDVLKVRIAGGPADYWVCHFMTPPARPLGTGAVDYS